MAKLTVQQARELGRQIVLECETGIRYSDLVRRISEAHPETPKNTIKGAVWDLDTRFPDAIHKPSRGLFLPIKHGEEATPPVKPSVKLPREEEFYAPFADWLKNELDEVTVAVPIGGAGFQKKWGTPDVVGVYKPLPSHRIKFDLEIVSAEIKVDPNQPVVAFGQAVAYRLFSAKSYVVLPTTIAPEDYGRLEALCMLFGIGLVLFEANVEDPNFSIRVRAQRFPPDMFYVNEFADRLYQADPGVFNQLFG
ncbi:MAG: hypothetical protein KatS3mg015_2954 [Fimbriimonadales bacterium]|nr:MAG: hypothetical protein KatS3mg015_2954 [Fimbriimonadales bacterium]